MKTQNLLLFVVPLILNIMAKAQTGYIYIHKKTLSEDIAANFTFSISGGTTSVPNFTLNDESASTALRDLGSSQNGRLWAVGSNNTLYYRDMGSSGWQQPGINTAGGRIDGGPNGNVVYINGSQVFTSSNGIGGTALNLTNFVFGGSNPIDVAWYWGGTGPATRIYVCTNAGTLYGYNGISWSQIGSSSNNVCVDINPVSGAILVGKTDGNVYSISPATPFAQTSLGRPGTAVSGGNAIDIAADDQGDVYAVYDNAAGLERVVYPYVAGSWGAAEASVRTVRSVTAGLGGQVWGKMETVDDYTHTIFTRSGDGTGFTWLDDERVRRVPVAGNAQMIAVAPGTYTVTESPVAGWSLQKIQVLDPSANSSANVAASSATLNVAAGETVHVIFTNGYVNPFSMTNSCTNAYLETFGTGATGTFGPPLTGQTSYHFRNDASFGYDGYYKVVSRASDFFSPIGSTTFFDHTSGNGMGRMMAVNASYEKNEFFRRRFTGLVIGATYNFSAWIASIYEGPIKPNVTFEIIDPSGNTVLHAGSTGNITPANTWNKYGLSFVATTTSIDLMLVNNAIGGNGNDLALDDVSFELMPVQVPVSPVTPPTTFGTATGSISITSPTGSSYEHSIDNVSWQSTPLTFPNLASGIYTVRTRFVGTVNCQSSKLDTVMDQVIVCKGITRQLNYAGTPVAVNPWISSDPGVATVSNTGLVKAIAAGIAIIQYKNTAGDTRFARVAVDGGPSANAGLDLSICQVDTIATAFVNGATATAYTNLSWNTYNGTGVFGNNTTTNALTTATYDPTTADHNAIPPGANLVLTATNGNGCIARDTMRLNIKTQYTWAGTLNEDFAIPGNWLSGCVPPQHASINFASNVVNVCKLDQPRYLNNVTNDSNAVAARSILDINGKKLTVEGVLSFPQAAVTGRIKANGAADTLELKGMTSQSVPANVFVAKTASNLRIDNASGVTAQDSIFITHTLQPVTGTLNTAGQLTLRSTASLTARVTPIANTTTASVSGNVIVERYIPSDANRAWRLLSACVQPATAPTIFQSWQENMRATMGAYHTCYGTFISAPGAGITNGYDSSSFGPSLQYWNGTGLVTPATTNNVVADKITSNGGAWFLFVRGDKTIRPEYYQGSAMPYQGATTLRQTGILNQGTVTVGQAGTNFSMIPNPYAAPVDLDAVGTTNVLTTFYVWDSKMNTIGGYRTLTKSGNTYTATPSTGNITDDNNLRYLQSGQGFLIPGNKQLNFNEAMKTGNSFTYSVYKTASTDRQLEVELYNANNPASPELADGVRLYLDDSYSNEVLAKEDVIKPENTNENLAIAEGGDNLVISKRGQPTATDTIQLKIWKIRLGTYKIRLKSQDMDENLSIAIIDRYTNLVTPISTGTTDYQFAITNTTGSWDMNRFIITITKNKALSMTDIRLSTNKQSSSGVNVTWHVASQKDIIRYEVERSQNGKDFKNMQMLTRKRNNEATTYSWVDAETFNGVIYYRVKGQFLGGEYVYSNTAQLKVSSTEGTVHIYPNPVTARTFTVTLSDLRSDAYEVELYNEHGQKVQTTTIHHNDNVMSYEVRLGSELPAGNYVLKLTQGNQVLFTQKMVIMKQ